MSLKLPSPNFKIQLVFLAKCNHFCPHTQLQIYDTRIRKNLKHYEKMCPIKQVISQKNLWYNILSNVILWTEEGSCGLKWKPM